MVFDILDFVYYVFGFPNSWMTFPNIIFYFFVPLTLLTAIYALFLQKGAKVLSTGPNIALAVIIALLTSRIAVITANVFGMIGGDIVLSFVLVGLSAIFYRFAIDAVIIVVWAMFIVLGCFFKGLGFSSILIYLFGFLTMISFVLSILKITPWRTFFVLLTLLIITIVLIPLALVKFCPTVSF